MNALAIITQPVASLPALPIAEVEAAADYARNSKAAGTIRGYKSDLAIFEAWCRARAVPALPASPETVATYLASLAESGLMPNTISRRCSAIKYGHKLAGHESPTDREVVKATLSGIRRTVQLPSKRKSPVLAEMARTMASAAPGGMKGIRDKAILLLGFSGAFRRSELVALDIGDLVECDDGYRVTIRKSKTDQEGIGVTIAIVRGTGTSCPVKAVKAWLAASGITEGAIFRSIRKGGKVRAGRLSSKAICDVTKAYAGRLGLDSAAYGAHSLRAGFLTSAARRGASIFKMKDVSRHRSMDVLSAYVRDANLFEDHAGAGLL